MAVVITTYNHARYLDEAIRSVQDQTVPSDEIIVVDDGSTDRPEDVVAGWPGVGLIRQDNAGLAAARNTGWRAATSEHVIFLDADDRLLPGAIELGVRRLGASGDAAFSYGSYVTVDGRSGERQAVALRPAEEGFASFLRANVIGMHATVMYRRARLVDVGGFLPGLPACEDYEMYLRLSSRYPLTFGPEVLAEYWLHDQNMSRDSAMMLRAALDVLQRYEEEARLRALLPEYRQGVRTWKRHYAAVWWRSLALSLRSTPMDRSLVRQASVLVALAPVTMAVTPCRVLGRRLRAAPSRFRPVR